MKLSTQVLISCILAGMLYGIQASDNPAVKIAYEKVETIIKEEYTEEEIKEKYETTKNTLLNMENYIKNTWSDIDETMEKERANVVQ